VGANLALTTHWPGSMRKTAQLAHDTELLKPRRSTAPAHHMFPQAVRFRMMSPSKSLSSPPRAYHSPPCASLTLATWRSRPGHQRLRAEPVVESAPFRPPLRLVGASLPHSSIFPLRRAHAVLNAMTGATASDRMSIVALLVAVSETLLVTVRDLLGGLVRVRRTHP
jgi:hypothetical protein